MSSRKNIKIDDNVYDQLEREKGSSQTWSEFLSRLLNSVAEGQVHLNRATLEDFDQPADGLEITASENGKLEITIEDTDGNPILETNVSSLEPNQSVIVNPTQD